MGSRQSSVGPHLGGTPPKTHLSESKSLPAHDVTVEGTRVGVLGISGTPMKAERSGAIPPLEQQNKTAVDTATAAFYLNRRPQTLRIWACKQNGPIRPININGRLAWPVCQLRSLLAGSSLVQLVAVHIPELHGESNV